MLAVWILGLLGVYAAINGIVPFSGHGVSYRLDNHRPRPVDIRRLLSGQPVRDLRGTVVVDPAVDTVTIVVARANGEAELRFRSVPDTQPSRNVVIIVPSSEASYQDVVHAMDQVTTGTDGASVEVLLATAM